MSKNYVPSQPQYNMIVEKNVMVTARDGVKLAVNVFRPDAPGKFPGLLAISVYGKESQTIETPPQPMGGSVFEASIESGNPEYFVSRGYAFVIADYRGCGDSEGEMPGMLSKYEAEDGYDVIEWMAEQPWCDGNIGGCGICYFGFVQIMIAELQPPHLKCITPWEINYDDFYKHGLYEGGVHHIVWYGLYAGCQPPRIGNAHKNMVPAMLRELDPDELKRRVEKALEDPDLRQYPYIKDILYYPYLNPIIFDALLNPTYNEWWESRSYGKNLDKVKVPTYVGGPMWGPFGNAECSVYNGLTNCEFKKLNLYPELDDRPWRGSHDEMLRWYDQWLKGMDTGILDEPPVKFTTAPGVSFTAESWPPAQTQYKDLYLYSLRRLSDVPELYNDEPDAFTQQPLYVTEERAKVVYTTPPLPADLHVTGNPIVKFWASIDKKDTTWRVDIREHGSTGPCSLTQGWLRASMRKRIPEEDKPWYLEHDFTQFDYPEPGEIYEYEIMLRPMAMVFKAGTQIDFEISCIDIPTDPETYDCMWHICPAQTCMHKIYRDKDHPSVLKLPIANL